ncbi:MAG: Protein YhfA [Fimbriimonadaceae bacterium]|nr:Protein YhfA [Fimbriimonadaceae bacterium]
MIEVRWKSGMAFDAETQAGTQFGFDAYPDSGGQGNGPTPLETFLAAAAACAGMDVVSILLKKRQDVRSYRIEVEGDRQPPGSWPRPYTTIRFRHIVEGDVDPEAVARAVELTDEKYCSVLATLRSNPAIESSWEVSEFAMAEDPDPAQTA